MVLYGLPSKPDPTGVCTKPCFKHSYPTLLASRGTPPHLRFIQDTNWVLEYHQVLDRDSLHHKLPLCHSTTLKSPLGTMPTVTWQLYPPRLYSVLWQPAPVKTCWDHSSSMFSWPANSRVFLSANFSSTERNKQYASEQRHNLCTHKCFVETGRGSSECEQMNMENRGNEGRKITQP